MTITARVAITPADGTIVVETFDLPAPGEHDVVVRTIASGICHSQLTELKMASAMGRPSALGHEATGEVVEVGTAVTSVSVGDLVFVTWLPRDGAPDRRPGSPVLTRGRHAGHLPRCLHVGGPPDLRRAVRGADAV